MADQKEFDVVIIGAGPAGYTTALCLAPSGLRIAIADKEEAPGEKICGDALSGTVMSVLKRLPANAWEDFLNIPGKLPSSGIRFYSPGKRFVDIPFSLPSGDNPAAGYICSRKIFDEFLQRQLLKFPNIINIKGFNVENIYVDDDEVVVSSADSSLRCSILTGADGANSTVSKILTKNVNQPENTCLGVRSYYKNVKDLHPENFIELHFIKEILPGYLWIFPMADGMANVGMGMMMTDAKKQKYPIARLLEDLISSDPNLNERFKNAEKTGKTGAHTLPMGPSGKQISGNRFILTGDAASLVDPFTGEGIGNAMISGEIAASVILQSFERQDFSAVFLKKYDTLIEKKLKGELETDKRISKLASKAWLFNFVVKRINKNQRLKNLFTQMYTNPEIRKKLRDPMFYVKILIPRFSGN